MKRHSKFINEYHEKHNAEVEEAQNKKLDEVKAYLTETALALSAIETAYDTERYNWQSVLLWLLRREKRQLQKELEEKSEQLAQVNGTLSETESEKL